MSLFDFFALFGAMILLALVPSPSVFAVIARSLSAGFLHGAMTTLGILIGDLLFILFAVFGLSYIAEGFENLFRKDVIENSNYIHNNELTIKYIIKYQ